VGAAQRDGRRSRHRPAAGIPVPPGCRHREAAQSARGLAGSVGRAVVRRVPRGFGKRPARPQLRRVRGGEHRARSGTLTGIPSSRDSDMAYRAPVKEIRFVLDELIGTEALKACPEFNEYSTDTANAVLEEAAKFAEVVLEPLCKSGDREGAKWSPNGVTMPAGFKDAYQQFCDSGWPALRAETEFGGQGVPAVLGTAVEELWASSNLAFKLCPMLTQGAIEALQRFGAREQKAMYLPKMV